VARFQFCSTKIRHCTVHQIQQIDGQRQVQIIAGKRYPSICFVVDLYVDYGDMNFAVCAGTVYQAQLKGAGRPSLTATPVEAGNKQYPHQNNRKK